MSVLVYWWLRFGHYSPGPYNLPHMGEIITDYRKRRGLKTQDEFAIAAGFDKRTVQEWEASMMITDMGRRIFLARMLKIPPALLGLQWRQVYGDTQDEQNDSLEHLADLIEEDAFYTYEDILILGWECSYLGGPPEIDYRIERRLKKLETIVRQVREPEREAWQALLVQYHHLAESFAQHRALDKARAQQHATSAIQLATEMDDKEFIASSFLHRTYTNLQQERHNEAKSDIRAALDLIEQEQVRSIPLIGNIYLMAADVHGYEALDDKKLQDQCRAWQNKAANLAYAHKGAAEPDTTFLKFNLSAVNHERAKLLLRFAKRDDTKHEHPIADTEVSAISSKMRAAWKTLSPDLNVWKIGYHMTEARLYQTAHDLEGSAKSAIAALKVARSMHNLMGENNVRKLYFELDSKGTNPYVINLGVELGIY